MPVLTGYDRKILIEQIERDANGEIPKDTYGEPVINWIPFASVWARRTTLTGREFWAAQQIAAGITTSFQIRFLEGVEPRMRIVDDGMVYDIHQAVPSPARRQWIEILASARAEGGT